MDREFNTLVWSELKVLWRASRDCIDEKFQALLLKGVTDGVGVNHLGERMFRQGGCFQCLVD